VGLLNIHVSQAQPDLLSQLLLSYAEGLSIYRWTGVRQLHLIDVKTGQIQAQLDTTWASKSCSEDQGRFVFYGSNHDSTWMRIVIASGLAESENVSRLVGRYPRLEG